MPETNITVTVENLALENTAASYLIKGTKANDTLLGGADADYLSGELV